MLCGSVCRVTRLFGVASTTVRRGLHTWTPSTHHHIATRINCTSVIAHNQQHSHTAASVSAVTESETESRQITTQETKDTSQLQRPKDEELRTMKVAAGQFYVPRTSASLAAYVNASETLTALVLMGVDLSQIEQNPHAANYLVKLDFERDIQPYIVFLHQLGLSAIQIAQVITHTPAIFQETLENVEIRVNYLASKGFSDEQIVHVVSRGKGLLLTATKDIDSQLGYLQREFSLTGSEVREVVSKLPKIVLVDKETLRWSKFNLLEFLGFTETQMKNLLLEVPRLYLENRDSVSRTFDYLHNVMGLTHWNLLRWPNILLTRDFIVRERHEFLAVMGRDQYNPNKENYASLKALATASDEDFCQTVAKVPLSQYEDFLKTL